MKISKMLCGVALSTLLLSAVARADVKLHPLFSDDMVLQRDKPVPVWGEAGPNEKVAVSIGNQSKSTQADATGNWSLVLKPMPAAQNLSLDVKGQNEIVLKNVAVGDVYICSGQSNMEFGVGNLANGAEEIAAANYPNIRLFMVPHQISGTPQKNFSAPTQWKVCNPQNIAQGGWNGFSAVGYFFGRELNQKLKIPIGLIDSSWGGTIAQAWTSRSTLAKRDDFKNELAAVDQNFQATGTLDERTKAWWTANDAGSKSNWAAPEFDAAAWKEMTLPQFWEAAGLPDFDGLVWFRREVEVPANMAGKPLKLFLGAIDDSDTTFWNGASIGTTNGWTTPREYSVPGELVKAGRNVLAVRVYDSGGGGGLHGDLANGARMRLEAEGAEPTFLDGAWKYQVSSALKDLPPFPSDFSSNPNQPTVLYNGMIAPLVPFALRGAIWYQGESNAGNPAQYRTLFPDLIKDWRSDWNAKQDGSEFGFYFVQLANFMARSTQPVESGWAELRDAQTNTLKVVPRTGMATILDVGDAADIHPKNKLDVGKRLALAALATEYKQQVEYSGPVFDKMETVAGKIAIRIRLSHAQGLKTTDGAAPRGFAINEGDGKWHAANARIEGESVILWSDEVLILKAVRYAWANNPDVNLVNAAGLPAVPFATDAPK